MNISVILGHPRYGSFNHAIANVIIETLRNLLKILLTYF